LAQEQPAFAEINNEDAAEAGIEDGAQVRLKTEAGEAVLPARVTGHIAKGAVFVPWNQPGFAANTLLSGSFTNPVTLERVEADQPLEVEA
jgi:predicted molibdopterin-dependent oxidoreductase YjgC